ncbi:tetratricopeptide repeat protein [Pedobacter sp. SYSU D00535]|uniref:tetratricopeptide repeat protein n=1 Tax=Pedobacter sp. SYSU D00535 TaxID=2810308 RepID=UPI001A963F4A|nr:tetratricopeptide repeat protein [Pedobacter sp. SYSU D00535]
MLNNYAWEIFKKCDDMACIQQALAWSKKTLEGKNAKEVMYLDTYANLLHKSGRTAEAIKIQEEAVALSGEKDDNGNLTKVLNKMKKGEKTW